MGSLKKTLVGAAIAVSMSSVAFAADPPVIDHPPELVPAEVGSGWYLRGDIGYSFNKTPSQHYNRIAFSGVQVDDSWTGGFGFGYKFPEYFRADFTIDYLDKYSKSGRYPCGGCGGWSRERGSISAWTFMANAYVDLGTWQGLTPYVGAGIGAGYITLGTHHGLNPGQPNNTFRGSNQWNLAMALMAGASYEVGDNVMIDAGYRYMWLGDTRTGLDPSGNLGGWVTYNNLASHQIRVGLRYMID